MTEKRFSGKTALVTGGAGGIGSAIARAFASEGAAIAVVDVNLEAAGTVLREIEKEGGRGIACGCDARRWDDVAATVQRVGDELGETDILVNCAGITRDFLLASMPVENWHEVIETNLNGPFHFIRAVVESMVVRRRGRIINISSLSGSRGGKGQSNYAASKAGLDALTRAVALELAPRGITVNAVAPGLVVTAMSATVRELAGKKLERAIPARRFAIPEDLTGVVLFLASPEASYLTGQVINVDGGLGLGVQFS